MLEEPYRYRLYYPLKGFEFDAIAKKSKKNAGTFSVRPKTVKMQLRSPNLKSERMIETQDFFYDPRSDFQQSSARGPKFIPPSPKIKEEKRLCNIIEDPCSPNEKRFSYNPRENDELSKIRASYSPTISFSKSIPRKNIFQAQLTQSQSAGDSENLGSPKLKGVPFSRLISRERIAECEPVPLLLKNPKLSEDLKHCRDKLSTSKRLVTPDFDKSKARYRIGQELPSFMENLNNRMSLTMLSSEMLKANRFRESEDITSHRREIRLFKIFKGKNGVMKYKSYEVSPRGNGGKYFNVK